VIYESEQGRMSIVLTGDSMITRGMSRFREPEFINLVELMRSAECTVSNLEMLFHDFEVSWQFKGGASFQVSNPRNLKELKWMGIDVVTTATNHAFDYGEGGFLTTLKHCDEADLLHAGGGRHLDEARAPAYLDTPGGRIAVMSSTSTYSPDSRAGKGRADFPGKPGVSVMRHEAIYHVPSDLVAAFRRAKRGLGFDAREASRSRQGGREWSPSDDGSVRFLNEQFRASSTFKVETRCNKEDLEGIGRWIRGAKKQADLLVFAGHSHESGVSDEWYGQTNMEPAQFMREFAHFAIDNGVDAFVSHGTHYLRGIEIYNGRPIFHSLGNFIFQNETVEWLPQPAYEGFGLSDKDTPGDWGWGRSQDGKRGHAANPVFYRSAVAECRFENHRLCEIWLHPIDMGFGRSIGQRGRPVMARGAVASEILIWLQRVSKPYGTEIAIEGEKGVIRL